MVITEEYIRDLLRIVPDPEIPTLSILDLGIVRDVNIQKERIEITITPTYSGCPAMDMITVNIKAVLQEAGLDKVKISSSLSPAWTTDWITPLGHQKLKEAGITPPQGKADKRLISGDFEEIPCPLCGSHKTELISQFGSTACKALFKCQSCHEPFDYFKCH